MVPLIFYHTIQQACRQR